MRKVELTSNHQREEFGQGPKETPVQMSYQPPRIHLSGIHLGATRKDPESERLARDNPETNPITIKPEAVSHIVERSSWLPLPSCSLLRRPFPIKSLFYRPVRAHSQALEGVLLLVARLCFRDPLIVLKCSSPSWEDFRPFSLHLCDFSSKC